MKFTVHEQPSHGAAYNGALRRSYGVTQSLQLLLNLRLHPAIHRLIEPLHFHVVGEVGFACCVAAFFVVGVAVGVTYVIRKSGP